MKLIHCSDLHLDSPLGSIFDSSKARVRAAELTDTLLRLVSYAKEHSVDAVLIAGDLFDGARVTLRSSDSVLSAISGAKDIDFYYLRGNHDESKTAFAGRTLPDNLKLFSDTWRCCDLGSACLYGIEPDARNAFDYYDALCTDPSRINLVMLHGQISSRCGEGLVCLPRLAGRGIRRLVLGHLHSYSVGRLDEGGDYCYSGCLEGRGFDECGAKGFVEMELEGGVLRSRFVPFALRGVYEKSCNISGLGTVPELLTACEKAVSELPETGVIRLTLTGTSPAGAHKDLAYLESRLAQRFFYIKLLDESRTARNADGLAGELSLKGEFVRCVLDSNLEPAQKERVLRCGLAALMGEEVSP